MTDDPVTDAAIAANRRLLAITTTANLIQRRLDLRLIASDVAKLALARSVARVARIKSTPIQRKRALIGAGIATAVTIGMRVLYRTTAEKRSPEAEDNVKRLT